MAKQTIYHSILVISDLHAPFQHPDAVAFLKYLKKKYKPDLVVCTGDEIDNHALSFHDSDPNLPSAGDELSLAIDALKPVYKLFPNVRVMESNHGSLVYRKALSQGIPIAVLKSYREIIQAPEGWSWSNDLTVRTPLGQVYFHHSKGADCLRNSQAMGMSFVQGHHHEKFEVRYWGNPNALMFGMTVGCLADSHSLALAYAKNNLRRQVIGTGVIVDGIAHLEPMVLDKHGRWIGR